MLIRVVRHGFVFWEAAHSLRPPYEELSPRQEVMDRMRAKAREWEKVIPVEFATASRWVRMKRTHELRHRYNRRIWGGLVELLDEPPAGSPEEAGEILLKLSAMAAGTEAGLEVEDIQERVITAFGVSAEEFFGRSKKRKVTRARIASMALCRAHTLSTLEEVAEKHQRDHTLVLRSTQAVRKLRKVDAEFGATLGRVEASLRALKEAA